MKVGTCMQTKYSNWFHDLRNQMPMRMLVRKADAMQPRFCMHLRYNHEFYFLFGLSFTSIFVLTLIILFDIHVCMCTFHMIKP